MKNQLPNHLTKAFRGNFQYPVSHFYKEDFISTIFNGPEDQMFLKYLPDAFPGEIFKVLWYKKGQRDEEPWMAVGQINGGYFFYKASCCYTGFSACGSMKLYGSKSLKNILDHMMTPQERAMYLQRNASPSNSSDAPFDSTKEWVQSTVKPEVPVSPVPSGFAEIFQESFASILGGRYLYHLNDKYNVGVDTENAGSFPGNIKRILWFGKSDFDQEYSTIGQLTTGQYFWFVRPSLISVTISLDNLVVNMLSVDIRRMFLDSLVANRN